MKAFCLVLALALTVGCAPNDERSDEELIEDLMDEQEQREPLPDYVIEKWCTDLVHYEIICEMTDEELDREDSSRRTAVEEQCREDMADKAAENELWADCVHRKQGVGYDAVKAGWDECNAGDYE